MVHCVINLSNLWVQFLVTIKEVLRTKQTTNEELKLRTLTRIRRLELYIAYLGDTVCVGDRIWSMKMIQLFVNQSYAIDFVAYKDKTQDAIHL